MDSVVQRDKKLRSVRGERSLRNKYFLWPKENNLKS
jgi:hypothetical protein